MKTKKLDKKLEEFNTMTEEELTEKEVLLSNLDFDKLKQNLMKMNVEPLQQKFEERSKEIKGELNQLRQKSHTAENTIEKAEIIIQVEKLDQEVESMRIKIKEKSELVDKEVEEQKKELEQIKGYKKNKNQIDKINHYKEGIGTKLAKTVKEREDAENKAEQLKELVAKQEKDNLEDLNNNEYNEHFENIEELKKITAKIEELKKKETNYKAMFSKCDLAWKTLFYNKTWDDIQVRATNRNYTRKIETKSQNNKEDKTINEKTEGKGDLYKDNNFIENDMKQQNVEKEKATIIQEDELKEKHPILAKIRNFFTGIDIEQQFNTKENKNQNIQIVEYDEFKEKHPVLAKIKEFFKGTKIDLIEKQPIKDEKETKDTNKDEKETKDTVDTRDAFLEQLRKMVEPEGKKDIEQEYIEKHKKINKEKVTEEDIR